MLGFLNFIIEKINIYRPLALIISIFTLSFCAGIAPLSPAQAEEAEPEAESDSSSTVNELVTPGGDDVSYRIPLEVPVIFNNVSYIDVYATTNSVITFGQPDGTFWDYPMTPSVSLQARDWWARPHMGDEWFIIRTSSGGFQVDGAYRPYGSNSGPTTNIVITAQILTNGTVSYTYSVVGPLYGGERTGARLNDGSVATLEQVGVEEVAEPIVLEPEPVPEPETEPEPEPTPEPTPEPEEPDVDPETEVTPEPGEVGPNPTSPNRPSYQATTPSESNQLLLTSPSEVAPPASIAIPTQETEEVLQAPTPKDLLQQVLENPNSSVEEKVEAMLAAIDPGEAVKLDELFGAGLSLSDLPPETPVEIRTDEDGNPVVITAEEAEKLNVFADSGSIIKAIFNDLGEFIKNLQHVGKDMTEEEREESQAVVVSSVIVANIAHLASSAGAIGSAVTYRRNP